MLCIFAARIPLNQSIGKCALDANKLKDAPNGKPGMPGFRFFCCAVLYGAYSIAAD
jgi:hypothetical protein